MAEEKKLTRVKRKQWCQIMAPKMFGEEMIGETLVYDPSSFVGKTLRVNLAQITGDIKKQNIRILVKAKEVQGNNVTTESIGYELAQPSIRRMVRRGRDRIDLSFACLTSDKINIRIKPFILTQFKAKGSVKKALHNTAINSVIRHIEGLTYETLFQDIVSQKFQNSIKDELKKIYPLKLFAIKAVGIEAVKLGQQKQKRREGKKVEQEEEETGEEAEEQIIQERPMPEEEPAEQQPEPKEKAKKSSKPKEESEEVPAEEE